MDRIEVKILNPEVIKEAEKMMVCCARLTQKGLYVFRLGGSIFNVKFSKCKCIWT